MFKRQQKSVQKEIPNLRKKGKTRSQINSAPFLTCFVCVSAQEDRLEEIAKTAGLDKRLVLQELRKLAVVAEAHFKRGAREIEAWARASSDFPEYLLAQDMVSLFIGFTETTTELERTLKLVPLQERRDRASMLNTTLENLMLVSQAPLAEDMVTRRKNSVGDTVLTPVGNYLPDILKRWTARYGLKQARKLRKQRRDKGVARTTTAEISATKRLTEAVTWRKTVE